MPLFKVRPPTTLQVRLRNSAAQASSCSARPALARASWRARWHRRLAATDTRPFTSGRRAAPTHRDHGGRNRESHEELSASATDSICHEANRNRIRPGETDDVRDMLILGIQSTANTKTARRGGSPVGPLFDRGHPEDGLSPDSPGPSIFTAIQSQLGLKLESTKGPATVLVIGHVEKPSAN
jgi:hypothetical protein